MLRARSAGTTRTSKDVVMDVPYLIHAMLSSGNVARPWMIDFVFYGAKIPKDSLRSDTHRIMRAQLYISSLDSMARSEVASECVAMFGCHAFEG